MITRSRQTINNAISIFTRTLKKLEKAILISHDEIVKSESKREDKIERHNKAVVKINNNIDDRFSDIKYAEKIRTKLNAILED